MNSIKAGWARIRITENAYRAGILKFNWEIISILNYVLLLEKIVSESFPCDVGFGNSCYKAKYPNIELCEIMSSEFETSEKELEEIAYMRTWVMKNPELLEGE